MMNYWIQRANFESQDFTAANVAEIVEAFERHDWKSEEEFRAHLEAAGKEWCAPGLGINAPGGYLLHLCPDGGPTMLCHYHFREKRRFLGIVSFESAGNETWDDAFSRARDLINLFVGGHYQDLLRRSRGVV